MSGRGLGPSPKPLEYMVEDFSTLVATVITFFFISVIWGWPIMLVAGSLGWNISFIAACGIGFLVQSFIFAIKADFNFGEKK